MTKWHHAMKKDHEIIKQKLRKVIDRQHMWRRIARYGLSRSPKDHTYRAMKKNDNVCHRIEVERTSTRAEAAGALNINVSCE
jgi:hypothetical protein